MKDALMETYSLESPLYEVIGNVAALWILANAGYFFVFPIFGLSIDYNISPIPLAVYFFLWSLVSIFYFWKLFNWWFADGSRIWAYVVRSLIWAGLVWVLLYVFSQLPATQGRAFAPYADVLFATPWYFLPKSAEVLMQQILIAILVLALHVQLRSFREVLVGYVLTFGGAHVLLFMFSKPSVEYANIMTTAAVLSVFVFPYLILKVRGGLVYAYVIHLLFYILFAMAVNVWPPSSFFGS